MRVVKVCKGGCGSKKAVWIDGGIHAREWVSPATVTWMLEELVQNNDAHPELTEDLDWYILPCHNPDGYAYSRSSDRMWRKTRSVHNSLFGCKGVDANRNWGFHWNEGGSSNNKCTDTYHGPEAFSEPENVNVKNFIETVKDSLIFYNTIHSYSQLVLLPWSYTSTVPDDYDSMYAVAMKGSEALTSVMARLMRLDVSHAFCMWPVEDLLTGLKVWLALTLPLPWSSEIQVVMASYFLLTKSFQQLKKSGHSMSPSSKNSQQNKVV